MQLLFALSNEKYLVGYNHKSKVFEHTQIKFKIEIVKSHHF